MLSLGNKLKSLRQEKGLEQKELAKVLSVPNNTLSNWENNVSFPRMATLEKLSNYFNVSIEYLINDEASKHHKIQLCMTEKLVEGLIENNLVDNPDMLDDNTKLLILNTVVLDLKTILKKR